MSVFSALPTTRVFDSFWYFAAERQAIFFKRFRGELPPWTDDRILQEYKFTNAYRASDRVSQYLIREVIYGKSAPASLVSTIFRVILFKIFNKIDTWVALESEFGAITYEDFDCASVSKYLDARRAQGKSIYSGAYIMPPGVRAFGSRAKHRNHLSLVMMMMEEGLPARICAAESMQAAFSILRSYPTIGDFLAYQLVTDINYTEQTGFSEREFVVPGPGAKSGISKCFGDLCGLSEEEIIWLVMENQAEEFERRDLDFEDLWGRPLQLIDCQNLFCEVDKYARVRHPRIEGQSARRRIKQKFTENAVPLTYCYPRKWNLSTDS